MNLRVIIPLVQALVTCQLQGEHSSQFFFMVTWYENGLCRKIQLTYSNNFFQFVLPTSTINMQIQYKIVMSHYRPILYILLHIWCLLLYWKVYGQKIMMTLVCVHHNQQQKGRKGKINIGGKKNNICLSQWQAIFLDHRNVSLVSLESISFFHIGFLLCETEDHTNTQIWNFGSFVLLFCRIFT